MKNPNAYVGRLVSLNPDVFRTVTQQGRCKGTRPENRFIVAEVSRKMGKLVCYGANFRVAVGVSDVALV